MLTNNDFVNIALRNRGVSDLELLYLFASRELAGVQPRLVESC